MNSKFLACSLLLFCAVSFAASKENVPIQVSDAVVLLTDDNFNNHVTNTSSWLVMYYAPWCPHCKHALPAFDQFAQKMAGQINVGYVDCDANPNLRSRFSVGGYPTFLFLNKGMMYSYRGPRNVEAWTNFTTIGYKDVEGEETPLEANMLKNFIKEFGRFFEQLKFAFKAQPLLFGGILAGFVLVIALTCFCGNAVEDKIREKEEARRAAATGAAGGAGVGAADASQQKDQVQKKKD